MFSSSRQSAHTALRVGATFASAVILWCLVLFLTAHLASLHDPWRGDGRVWPYTQVHLAEEYVEGAWNPLSDVLFLLAAAARNVVAFAMATILGRRLLRGTRVPVWLAAFGSLVVVQAAFHVGAASLFLRPCLFELVLGVLGVALGLGLCRWIPSR